MTSHDVVIAGGGPTGMMLAAELALAGVDAVVVERRSSQALVGSRAGGLHSRTIEILDMRGVADRFLDAGQVAQVGGFAGIPLDISDFPTRHPYGLALWQNRIEELLAEWVRELGVRTLYATEVTAFKEDESGVHVSLSTGSTLRAQLLAGCDGGRSLVRRAAGIGFPGFDATVSHVLAEVEMTDKPEIGMRRNDRGMYGLSRVDYEIRDGKVVFSETGPVRVMLTEEGTGRTEAPTLAELSAALIELYGTDFGVHSPIWLTRFSDASRQAASYLAGRVLLAGDAAHIHYPAGGQGLNLGIQDAVNLGWKLAQVVKGQSPVELLGTYHSERHPVGAKVLQNTMAQVALMRPDDRTAALRDTMTRLLAMDEPRRDIAAMISGLDIHYDLGEGHPLLGRRIPDLDLVSSGGRFRVYSLLRDARPVLLNLDAGRRYDVSPWEGRVRHVQAEFEGRLLLPVIGAVAHPGAVLIRPDGHVAWVQNGAGASLSDALSRWFGEPHDGRMGEE